MSAPSEADLLNLAHQTRHLADKTGEMADGAEAEGPEFIQLTEGLADLAAGFRALSMQLTHLAETKTTH